jgi:hypothetical protein
VSRRKNAISGGGERLETLPHVALHPGEELLGIGRLPDDGLRHGHEVLEGRQTGRHSLEVDLRRDVFRKAPERVVEVELAVPDPVVRGELGRGQHRPAQEDAALDEVSGHRGACDVLHRGKEAVETFDPQE